MLIIGDGYIGSQVSKYFDADICAHKIYSVQQAHEIIKDYEIIINCAGYNSVDGCEIDRERAIRDNSMLPFYLSTACKTSDKKFIHISTGCIFEGKVDWHTTPNSNTMYAYSKILGESYSTLHNSDALVARIRLPFGEQEHPRELITKFLKMYKFHDIQNSFTCVEDFLWALNHLIKNDASGTYNIVNHGTMSPYEIARQINQFKPFKFEKVEFDDIKTDVKRVNVQMTTNELNKLGIPMRDIKEALNETLEKRFPECVI